jgi:hypothetical protein
MNRPNQTEPAPFSIILPFWGFLRDALYFFFMNIYFKKNVSNDEQMETDFGQTAFTKAENESLYGIDTLFGTKVTLSLYYLTVGSLYIVRAYK